jgi:hypothetical protein
VGEAEGREPASEVPVLPAPQPLKVKASRSPAAVEAKEPPRRPEFVIITVVIQSAGA